ncbi:MAG: hypothetical protein ABFR82_06950 [Nitrospirota bacterium]
MTIKTDDGKIIAYDELLKRMDPEVVEIIHEGTTTGLNQQQFYNVYCQFHEYKYNESFVVD